MSIVYSSVVPFPQEDVFAWHARPGAFARLTPPWQPMRLVREAPSLRDGRAMLGLPAGLRWFAQHEPESYDPPRQFVDHVIVDGVASYPARLAAGRWRHVHEFRSAGTHSTEVIDRVHTTIPEFALRSMFEYRHAQLADDLAAHRAAAAQTPNPLRIAMTGSSGLIGAQLAAFLETGGHTVIRLVRRAPDGPLERQWDPEHPAADLLDGVDALVHLAGASIAGRFTAQHKAAIRDSRIAPTRRLAEVAAASENGPRAFVCASAIGFYGADRGDAVLTESSERGSGFLADVVADWEAATAPAADGGVRVVNIRTGIVQTPRGGTLQLLYPLFFAGLGGRLGSGRQWLSWIDIDDLVDVYHRALVDDRLSGPVNAVAPEPVRNIDYTKELAAVLRRPAALPVPSFGPRLLLGKQGADELAEANQQVVPQVLTGLNHRFRRPELSAALRHQLGRFSG